MPHTTSNRLPSVLRSSLALVMFPPHADAHAHDFPRFLPRHAFPDTLPPHATAIIQPSPTNDFLCLLCYSPPRLLRPLHSLHLLLRLTFNNDQAWWQSFLSPFLSYSAVLLFNLPSLLSLLSDLAFLYSIFLPFFYTVLSNLAFLYSIFLPFFYFLT